MKIWLSLLMLFFGLQMGLAQTQQAQKFYYLAVKVKYGLKKGGITSEMEAQIGNETDHPFYGKVINHDHEYVTISTQEGMKEFRHELDLFTYLKGLGWYLESAVQVDVLNSTYTQFLWVKEP